MSRDLREIVRVGDAVSARVAVDDDIVFPAAQKLADDLSNAGVEVAIDDRLERPGVKFAEADLIGWPLQIIVGKRGIEAGNFELKLRKNGKRCDIKVEDACDAIAQRVASFYGSDGGLNVFDDLFVG